MAYKNPADALAWKRKKTALGFKGATGAASYVRQLERSNLWNKLHPQNGRASAKKYREKLRAVVGTDTPFNRWLYARIRKGGRLKK